MSKDAWDRGLVRKYLQKLGEKCCLPGLGQKKYSESYLRGAQVRSRVGFGDSWDAGTGERKER